MKSKVRYIYKCDNEDCGKLYVLLKNHHLLIQSRRREVDTNTCGKCLIGELVYVGEGKFFNHRNFN